MSIWFEIDGATTVNLAAVAAVEGPKCDMESGGIRKKCWLRFIDGWRLFISEEVAASLRKALDTKGKPGS